MILLISLSITSCFLSVVRTRDTHSKFVCVRDSWGTRTREGEIQTTIVQRKGITNKLHYPWIPLPDKPKSHFLAPTPPCQNPPGIRIPVIVTSIRLRFWSLSAWILFFLPPFSGWIGFGPFSRLVPGYGCATSPWLIVGFCSAFIEYPPSLPI